MALKPASAGSGPGAGIHVNAFHSISLPEFLTTGTTITLQYPTTGNLLILAYESSTTNKITSISSSPSNTWSNSAGCVDHSTIARSWCIWYAANASTFTNLTITITITSGLDEYHWSQANLWDVSGAASSPFDVSATAQGYLSAPSGTVNGPSLTPSTSNGLIVAVDEENNQATQSISPGTTLNLVTNGTIQYLSAEHDSGASLFYNPGTSAFNSQITFYPPLGSATNVAEWYSIAAAFKAL
jgi:hypothetical protein